MYINSLVPFDYGEDLSTNFMITSFNGIRLRDGVTFINLKYYNI